MVHRRGDNFYVYRNSGLQNQDVMYQFKNDGVRPRELFSGSAGDAASVFLDLNELDKAGTTSMGSSAFSEDGKLFAYGLCRGAWRHPWCDFIFRNLMCRRQ